MGYRKTHGDLDAELHSTIHSPCVRNCCLDDDDICMGCFRSLKEITGWGIMKIEQRREIFKQAENRRKEHHRKWAASLGLLSTS